MGMPAQQTGWTAELARGLPDDGNRYEVLDGELFVTPAPSYRHQAVLARFYDVIRPYVERHSLGWTRWSPADIEFSPKRMVQPDLFVIPNEGQGEPRSWKDVQRLLLALEALSPNSARIDRLKKRPMYQQHQVPEFWVVDIDSRVVERWRPGDERPEVISGILDWQPKPDLAALRILLDEIFGPAEDEVPATA
jgi:Uma2 family endonuclease